MFGLDRPRSSLSSLGLLPEPAEQVRGLPTQLLDQLNQRPLTPFHLGLGDRLYVVQGIVLERLFDVQRANGRFAVGRDERADASVATGQLGSELRPTWLPPTPSAQIDSWAGARATPRDLARFRPFSETCAHRNNSLCSALARGSTTSQRAASPRTQPCCLRGRSHPPSGKHVFPASLQVCREREPLLTSRSCTGTTRPARNSYAGRA